MKTCKLRFLSPSDWPEVMDIERSSFEYPWREFDFRKTCRDDSVTCLVAEADCEVVGYAVFDRLERNIVLLNLAVHPKYRGSGVGVTLIDAVKARVRGKVARVLADVSEYSDPAHLFLRKMGFVCTEIIADYFDETDGNTPQDAYRFVWEADCE